MCYHHTNLGNSSCVSRQFSLGEAWVDDIESNFDFFLVILAAISRTANICISFETA
jgi:hypothetical protein